jgi:hypothetical protein
MKLFLMLDSCIEKLGVFVCGLVGHEYIKDFYGNEFCHHCGKKKNG